MSVQAKTFVEPRLRLRGDVSEVALLAYPVVLQTMAETAMQVIDTAMVGRLACAIEWAACDRNVVLACAIGLHVDRTRASLRSSLVTKDAHMKQSRIAMRLTLPCSVGSSRVARLLTSVAD